MTVPFGVVILVISKRPDEGDKPDPTKKKRDRDQVDEHFHDCAYFSRSALSDTVMEEEDIARAAIRGVASPTSATGTAIRL